MVLNIIVTRGDRSGGNFCQKTLQWMWIAVNVSSLIIYFN